MWQILQGRFAHPTGNTIFGWNLMLVVYINLPYPRMRGYTTLLCRQHKDNI